MNTLTMEGRKYVLVPEPTYDRLIERVGQVGLPSYPPTDAKGRRPGKAYIQVSIARDIIKQRVAAGWSQEELAKRAGVRVETISRLEGAKHRPQAATLEKIERAFEQA